MIKEMLAENIHAVNQPRGNVSLSSLVFFGLTHFILQLSAFLFFKRLNLDSSTATYKTMCKLDANLKVELITVHSKDCICQNNKTAVATPSCKLE